MKSFKHAVKHRKSVFGRNRIEHLANMVVTGDLFDPEKTLSIALSVELAHCLLISKE